MKEELQVSGSLVRREDQLVLTLPGLGPSGSPAARILQCESSEDGDGRRGVVSSDPMRAECTLPWLLQFAGSNEERG